jgi:protoporphyrinogen oxidase
MKIAVVGVGMAGLAAAYDLTRWNHEVTVYEADGQVGGLAAGFWDERWDWSLERFYHHWFANDEAIIGLIEELGLKQKLVFPRPITSNWHEGEIYQHDSPLSALRLPIISWPAKIRYGLTGLYLKYLTRDWHRLEQYTAHEWLQRTMGQEAYETLWKPLFIGKFGEYYQEVNMAWFWARIYKRTSRLGTFEGGFQAMADAIADRVRQQGGSIRFNTPVQRIERLITPEGAQPAASHRLSVITADHQESFDAAIVTVGPGLMARLVPALPSSYLGQLVDLKSIGAVVLILALNQQLLERTYWLNLPARSPDQRENEFPFMALVEHTNYVPAEHFGGEHLVYCGDYVKPDHRYFEMSHEELLESFLPSLTKVNPAFDPSWVRRSWLFRAKYAQPVPPINHSDNIPSLRTPIPGLYFASMSQVYPWDRGTNYAVEMGRQVAAMAADDESGQRDVSAR